MKGILTNWRYYVLLSLALVATCGILGFPEDGAENYWSCPLVGEKQERMPQMLYDIKALGASLVYAKKMCGDGLIFKSHVVEDEAVNVGLFFQSLAQRLSASVSGFGVNADKHGLCARIVGLKFGGEFEAVGWYHTVIVVGCGHEGGGVVLSFAEIVQG